MTIRTAVTRYHPLLVALHWLLALLIILDLIAGTTQLARLPNDTAEKLEGLRTHMAGGLLILTLLLVRLGLRITTLTPPPESAGHPLLDRAAWLSHLLLYVAAIGMPLSGLLLALDANLPSILFLGEGALPASLWIYPLRYVHFILARTLMVLIALHIAGALYHTLIRKDGLLRRMGFGKRTSPLAPPSTAMHR
jgi:cytochrome b561